MSLMDSFNAVWRCPKNNGRWGELICGFSAGQQAYSKCAGMCICRRDQWHVCAGIDSDSVERCVQGNRRDEWWLRERWKRHLITKTRNKGEEEEKEKKYKK